MEKHSISWSAFEYEDRERSRDWYWAFGIIVIAGIVASILVRDYLFAIFIAIACGTILLFHYRKPEIIEFEIFEKGVRIKDAVFPFSKLNSYCIHRDDRGARLLLHSKRSFVPIITIPMPEDAADESDFLLAQHLKKEDIAEPHSHKIMDYLGF